MRSKQATWALMAAIGCAMHIASAQPLPATPATARPGSASDVDPRIDSALRSPIDVSSAARDAARGGDASATRPVDDGSPAPASNGLAARVDVRDPKCDLAAIGAAAAIVAACAASDRCTQTDGPKPQTRCRLGRLAR